MLEQNEIVEALRAWFLTCPTLTAVKQFGVDFVSLNPDDIAIQLLPTNISSKTDILGNVFLDPVQSQNFALSSTKTYSPEALNNLNNLGFFTAITNWMIVRNAKKEFPELPRVVSCMPTAQPVLFLVDEEHGNYQIQATLKYRV